jgi:glycosidase
MHKTATFYKDHWAVDSLKNILYHYNSIGDKDAIKLWFTSNHDENSWNGTEYEKYGDAAKAFAVHSFTWNGIPLIYSGQELPNLKRLEFFEKDVIEWNGKYELHEFYKTLLTLRKTNPALRTGDDAVITHMVNATANESLIGFLRKNGDHRVLVFLNMTRQDIEFTIEDEMVNGVYLNVFTGNKIDLSNENKIELKAWDYKVFER